VNRVIQACQAERVLLLTCGTYDQAVRIVPPLVVNADQIEEFLGVFRRAVGTL
jgi:4-aminobutyrate aminotransferase-like enzyme